MFENIENVLCAELEKINEKYQDGNEISSGDLHTVDTVFHALKSAETYKAMRDYDDGESGRSYARGRSRVTGRYMSRDGGSYMRSGRDPREMVDPYWDRR